MHPSRNKQTSNKDYGNKTESKLKLNDKRFSTAILLEPEIKMPLVNLSHDEIQISYDKAQSKESGRLMRTFEDYGNEP